MVLWSHNLFGFVILVKCDERQNMNVEDIWQQYSASLKAFLHSNVANPDDVDDLLQDILIKTYHNLGDIKETIKIKSWLFQVANRSIIDFYRKQAKAKAFTAEDLWYSEDDESIHQQLSRCVLPFIQALPADEAEMLTSIEINGLSQKEFAQKSGIKYSTLKSRVQKSRDKIHDLFKECCELSLDSKGAIIDFQAKGEHCNKC